MAFTGNYTCNTFRSGLMAGTFDFNTDTFKIALYDNSATLDADTAAYTATGEVTATGYTAGGASLTPTLASDAGTAFLTFADVLWTAALTARGALIYKEDGVDNPAVCVLDFGSDKTSLVDFTVQFPVSSATTAIIRIS